MRRKLKVGDLVYRVCRYTSEIGTSLWVITRYCGDGLWEIAKISNMDVKQVHHTLGLRKIKCE